MAKRKRPGTRWQNRSMHAALVRRADALAGCGAGTPAGAELASIMDAIEAYEVKRWPLGKIPGGKV